MNAQHDTDIATMAFFKDLKDLARITIPDEALPITDEDELINAMDDWAEMAADWGLIRLFGEDDFGPFWLGIEREYELVMLFLQSIDDVQHMHEQFSRETPQSRTREEIALERNQARQRRKRHVEVYASIVRDIMDPTRMAALGTLCQFAVAEDAQAMVELERLAGQPDVLRLLRDLAEDQGNPDQSAASAVLEALSVQEPRVAAKASYAERARQGASKLLDWVRSLFPEAARYTPRLVPGMARGTMVFAPERDEQNGSASIEVRPQIESGKWKISLVIENARRWANSNVGIVVFDVSNMEELGTQGVQWYWEKPGIFRSEEPASSGGDLLIELGVSETVAHKSPKVFYDALPNGFTILNDSDLDRVLDSGG